MEELLREGRRMGSLGVRCKRLYLNLLDTSYQALIQAAENANRYSDLVMSDMGQRAQEKAIILFNLLALMDESYRC